MGEQPKRSKFEILAEAFILYYPKFLTVLAQISDIFLTIVRTLLVTLGVPIVLVLVMQVEQPRISHGIGMFDTDEWLAGLAATVLIVLNTVLEFLIVYVEDKEGYVHARQQVFSLRSLWEIFKYRVGWSNLKDKSPAAQYEGVLTIVTYAILFLALMGSMKEEMQTYKGEQWTQALGDIMVKSDLPTMMTWISSLIFAFTLVYAVQALSRYVAVHTTSLMRDMQTKSAQVQTRRVEEQEEKIKNFFDPNTGNPNVKRTSPTAYQAVCPDCDKFQNVYSSLQSAEGGLRSHSPYCKKDKIHAH